MKHLDSNNPRFTAKALGEEETQPINPDANQEFEALQSFADTLKSELKTQNESDALTGEQKERVRAAIQPKEKKLLKFPVWINALAACLALGLVGIFSFKMFDRSKESPFAGHGVSRTLVDNSPADARAPGRSDTLDGRVVDELQEVEREQDQRAKSSAQPLPVAPPVKSEPVIRQAEELSRAAPSEEAVFELSPFSIEADDAAGYGASGALAGSRLRTEKKDFFAAADAKQASRFFSEPAAEPMTLSVNSVTTQSPNIRVNTEAWNREAYDRIIENNFKNPTESPLSTFSIDVDTASYANMRRYLENGSLPPADAVRIEELINYFSYDYAGPKDETPFAVHVDSAAAPWNAEHRLVRIGLQGDTLDPADRPAANLVFLIDVSGSMSDRNKLPLVQRSLNLLVEQMEARDRIAVVVYAGASGLALPSTTANNKETIQHAISNLRSGGSTNGGAGIELAYSIAQKHFAKEGINRVILCTDGDFNVGTSDRGGLTRLIEEKAKSGVFFSILGFGTGNYQDASMEALSNKGNGNYGYVDSFKEARKVFVDDMLGTLFTIAKDVKIQVEFNPSQVASYRLIGYENRVLAKEDFNDDTKDAGEIGAGHSVTALYEIIPAGVKAAPTASVDPLKYQKPIATEVNRNSAELLTVKLRYKQPEADESQLLEFPFTDSEKAFADASDDFRFASSVAAFGMLLRNSKFTESMTLADVRATASKALGNDSGGLRSDFVELVEKAMELTPKRAAAPAVSGPKE